MVLPWCVAAKLNHGIDLEQFKISQDPLFGVTVYEIAGLFYEALGPALAFCSSSTRPFSGLRFSKLGDTSLGDKWLDRFVARLRSIERGRSFVPWEPAVDRFVDFVNAIAGNPRHRDAEIHLVLGRRWNGAYVCPEGLYAMADHANVRIHYTPFGGRWSDFVQHWLRSIARWPMQESFIQSVLDISGKIADPPTDKPLQTLVVC